MSRRSVRRRRQRRGPSCARTCASWRKRTPGWWRTRRARCARPASGWRGSTWPRAATTATARAGTSISCCCPITSAISPQGRIDDETAIFYLACLLLSETQYYQLGGPLPDGSDSTNQLSYLILEAAHRLGIACNLTVRVHERMDAGVFPQIRAVPVRRPPGVAALSAATRRWWTAS